MNQTFPNPQFDKSHQQQITHDTTSVLIVIESPINILIDKIVRKAECVWGRVVFYKIKQYNYQKVKDKGNLALAVAQKMPIHIKDEVNKIVRYYEDHMDDQLHRIHKLVQQNTRLRKIIQKNEEDKQNNTKFNDDWNLRGERVHELQNTVIQKNKQIVYLNKEITQLISKVKKYKKRVYELQYKSPIKNVTQFE